MVLLAEMLHKVYSKLENHRPYHHEQTLSGFLQAFRSDVSSFVHQLTSNPGLEFMSLSWFHLCFQVLPDINKAFAKLVVAIDYPITKWKVKSFEVYLNNSLELLDVLNSVSCSISHLGRSRLLLSHALSLVESSNSSAVEKLRAVEFRNVSPSSKELKPGHNSKDIKKASCFDEDEVVQQALMELRTVGLWICSIVLSGLRGDAKANMDFRKADPFRSNTSLISNDSAINRAVTEKGALLKEVKELAGAADCLAEQLETRKGGDVAEMKRKLEKFEKMINGLGKEVDSLFSQVLAGRNQLLNVMRHQSK